MTKVRATREHRFAIVLALATLALTSGACIGEGARERLSKHEPISTTGQSVIAVTPPNNPSSSYFLDHPALLYEEIDIWCGNNQAGRRPELGGANNPCQMMCDTRVGFVTSVANIATSLLADAVGQLPRPPDGNGAAAGVAANLLACGVDAWAIEQLWNDSWCADANNRLRPECAIGIAANAACCAAEWFPQITVFSSNPLMATLSGVCAGGPMIGSWIEMNGFLNQCRAHILNETSMPISHQQGCMCQRQEMRSSWGVYHACGAPTQWAQIGTAQANCNDHDSGWLPVASQGCQGDGAGSGSTFYRYTNCQWVTNDQPQWCAFQNSFVDTATDIATPAQNACICNEEERTRNNAFGAEWACSPPRNAVMGTNMGINQCQNQAGDTGWLGAPGAACAAAGRPAGSTWLHRWNCRLITPSSALWPTLPLPARGPTQVTVAAGPNCPAITPPPPPPPPDEQCAIDPTQCFCNAGGCGGSGYGGSGYGSGSGSGSGSGYGDGSGSGSGYGDGSGSGSGYGDGSGSGSGYGDGSGSGSGW